MCLTPTVIPELLHATSSFERNLSPQLVSGTNSGPDELAKSRSLHCLAEPVVTLVQTFLLRNRESLYHYSI